MTCSLGTVQELSIFIMATQRLYMETWSPRISYLELTILRRCLILAFRGLLKMQRIFRSQPLSRAQRVTWIQSKKRLSNLPPQHNVSTVLAAEGNLKHKLDKFVHVELMWPLLHIICPMSDTTMFSWKPTSNKRDYSFNQDLPICFINRIVSAYEKILLCCISGTSLRSNWQRKATFLVLGLFLWRFFVAGSRSPVPAILTRTTLSLGYSIALSWSSFISDNWNSYAWTFVNYLEYKGYKFIIESNKEVSWSA